MNFCLQTTFTVVVNVAVTQAINNIKAKIYQNLQHNQQNNDQFDSSKFFDFSNLSDRNFNIDKNSFWRSNDSSFFDFKSFAFYKSNSVIEHDKNIYYRDVRLFCKKVQNLTVIKDEKLIWVNLNIDFFDYALVWSIAKLNVSNQVDLCDFWLENDWVKKFRLRFKSDHFADVDVLISQILNDIF